MTLDKDIKFSMSSFEGLRVLYQMQHRYPSFDWFQLPLLAKRWVPDANSLDFNGALNLQLLFGKSVPDVNEVKFYRECIERVVTFAPPGWARLIVLGRERLQAQLTRDEQQCFRISGLLEEMPSMEVIAWWDRMASLLRRETEEAKMAQGRRAELLSFEFERKRLQRLGIALEPRLISIDDNLAGYDILSFDLGVSRPVTRLIEVKSSAKAPCRFFLTRNEWDHARESPDSYFFHIWSFSSNEPRLALLRTADVATFVPIDKIGGKWINLQIEIADEDILAVADLMDDAFLSTKSR